PERYPLSLHDALPISELTDVNPGGTIADQLGALPQFFGNRGAQSSTGAMTVNSGSSQLNLRNLGANRTLVLFDGSRVVPADMTRSEEHTSELQSRENL